MKGCTYSISSHHSHQSPLHRACFPSTNFQDGKTIHHWLWKMMISSLSSVFDIRTRFFYPLVLAYSRDLWEIWVHSMHLQRRFSSRLWSFEGLSFDLAWLRILLARFPSYFSSFWPFSSLFVRSSVERRPSKTSGRRRIGAKTEKGGTKPKEQKVRHLTGWPQMFLGWEASFRSDLNWNSAQGFVTWRVVEYKGILSVELQDVWKQQRVYWQFQPIL